MSLFNTEIKYVFGGYNVNPDIRFQSTSGGAFSAIVDAFCDDNYVIFGAEADGLRVFHSYIEDKKDLSKYRKSKYSQSYMGKSYQKVVEFLKAGKKVLFSGTPCQIAGLKSYLEVTNTILDNLLMVEVICEGVPSPLYIQKYENYIQKKYNAKILELDYRYTGKSVLGNGKWDFQVMRTALNNRKKAINKDRWFNPFWSIWLKHLMSRPACYKCRFARNERTADISLGDLWGVHLYCPELYGKNGGASVIFANTELGKEIVLKAQRNLEGHELQIDDAIRYQSPMRKHIEANDKRADFMKDLMSDMTYQTLNKKWAAKPSIKLIWQKYFYGNRQKIALWRLKNLFMGDDKSA